jgi:hypothetical protein
MNDNGTEIACMAKEVTADPNQVAFVLAVQCDTRSHARMREKVAA